MDLDLDENAQKILYSQQPGSLSNVGLQTNKLQ